MVEVLFCQPEHSRSGWSSGVNFTGYLPPMRVRACALGRRGTLGR